MLASASPGPAAGLLPVLLVAVATVLVVVVVIGLHVWGAIQDGREEKAMHAQRHPEDRE